MPAANYNIVIDKGATFEKNLTIRDNANLPLDLTAVVSARSSLRTRPQDDTAYNFTVTVSDAVNGEINWTMSATNTNLLPAGTNSYDLEIEWADGRVERLLMGTATVRPNITR